MLSLEAARDVTHAIGGEDELDRVLELFVKRGRALVDARSVLIMLREGDELVVAASTGHVAQAREHRMSISGSTSGQVLERDRPQRITDFAGMRERVCLAGGTLHVQSNDPGTLVHSDGFCSETTPCGARRRTVRCRDRARRLREARCLDAGDRPRLRRLA